MKITTGSGEAATILLALDRIVALGRARFVFPILCHNLPASAGIDGLLGLDFLRDQVLEIDFAKRLIELFSTDSAE